MALVLCLCGTGMLSGQQIQCYSLEDGLPQSQVNDVVQDAQGYLWVATNGGGVCRFDGEDFELFNNGLNDLRIRSIDFANDELLATDVVGGCYVLNYGSKEQFVALDSSWIVDPRTSQIYPANASSTRIIAPYKVALSKNQWFRYPEYKGWTIFSEKQGLVIEKSDGFERTFSSIKNMLSFYLMKDQIWIGTQNNGIYIIDKYELKLIDQINSTDGLPSNDIRAIYEDRQGVIWIGTAGGGLCKYVRSGFHHIDRSSGFRDNEIDAIIQMDSTIYAANGISGLFKIEDDKATPIINNAALRNQNITALATDQYQRIWAATADQGIIIVNNDTVNYFNTDNGLISNQIKDIIYHDRSMWIATASDGIQHVRVDTAYSTYGTLQYYSGGEGMSDLFITDIERDGSDVIYTTSQGSLGRIVDGKLSHYPKAIGSDDPILTAHVEEDKVYLGTSGQGIWIADNEEFTFRELRMHNTSQPQSIHQLAVAADGALWAGSGQGVLKMDVDDTGQVSNIEQYGYNDGFVGVETRPRAILEDAQGQLWFGTMNGLTRYQSIISSVDGIKPALLIDNAEVDYVSIPNPESYSVEANKQIVFDDDQNNLSFSFRSIDLLHPDAVRYRWKINFNAWSPWSTDRKVTLGNLDHGKYRFQVQSMNKSGARSDIKDFNFEISTPLYKQAWFQVLGLFGLLFSGFGLLSRYLKRVNKKSEADRKALEQENYLLSLEQKALQLQMNPHFIFNVLNNIKALSLSDPKKSRSIINDFAFLMRSILENSRSKTITLEDELKTLEHYLKIELFMATRPFQYSVNVADDVNVEETMIPPMLVQPFVENAIHHGLAAVQLEGIIDIHFEAKGRYLHCTIVDNGIGIEESRKLKTTTSHNSVALAVTTDRIKSLDARQAITIEQLMDDDDMPAGTRVHFSIPHVLDY